ncbi:NitT/TauT family transport system ATP-binding protein [Roseinatronobacter thiooxidans]|uniref:NitT/TauT family transport system ATP-binding protein n=1 Tax=Roseinatronobacter thiooxidans TaxID=121821 RepID=A0A2W7QDW9_9RHOB|nr:ABC transporter ATP-binding protein [Roseinatronobacter thiooxidans]PZX36765.1 NitT/TauT family transport system ATP-binding protein [Roseinatronobacter thiooxidans]
MAAQTQKPAPLERAAQGVPIIEIEGLGKTFAIDTGPVVALESVDLTIRKGEFVSFVGPSGCGKSTLLNMVAGLLPASGGQAMLNGDVIEEPSRKVGFMFQTAVLLPWRTVEQNVLMPAEVFGTKNEATRQKARKVLEAVGLGDFTDAYPRQLSGGMQQRVSLARTLTYEPDVLLMDEPFGALDEFTREAMNLELMRITQAAGITVLFVTHNISEAVFMADRVVIMTPRPGKVSGVIDIDFPRPRVIEQMQSQKFTDLIFQVRGILGHGQDNSS